MPILTLLILIPAIGAILAALLRPAQSRMVAVVASGLTLLVALGLFGYTPTGNSPFGFIEERGWLPALQIGYVLGVDGPAVLIIVLTALVHLFSIWYSWDRITERQREYYALVLALEATILGAFCALDLILFYIFFEACLVPAYFLIGMWGGRRRIQAATKFFVYTVVGSLLMLASIIGLYIATGSFSVIEIQNHLKTTPLDPTIGLLIFAGFAIAFAVKTGLFPFHTWLPDTYAEAPTAVTAILSGVMAKLGTFGLYRFGIDILPDAARQFAPYIVALAVISILYGAWIAAVQRDAKRVLAYSSMSHLGFVVLGLFALTPEAMTGAFLQMLNHGITSAGCFYLMGMIGERRGSTNIRAFGGLWEQMPVFARIFLILTLSSIALPLTNGFVGEFLILLGSYQTFPWATALATTGVIFSAVYMLWMYQRVMYGRPITSAVQRMTDMNASEKALGAVLVALVFLLGIAPGWFTDLTNFAVKQAVSKTKMLDDLTQLPVGAANFIRTPESVPPGAVQLEKRR